jgi:hypothetical protein
MNSTRLAVLGIGSVRCGAPIIASLATFFGERPLDIRLYDADAERLDLFDRFARVCFLITKAPHGLMSTESPEEALQDAELVVLSLSGNCAIRLLKSRGVEPAPGPVPQAIDILDLGSYSNACILSLQREPLELEAYYRTPWPADITDQERAAFPFQLLRWLNEEEYPHELLRQCEKSPLKAWMDNPTTAQFIR